MKNKNIKTGEKSVLLKMYEIYLYTHRGGLYTFYVFFENSQIPGHADTVNDEVNYNKRIYVHSALSL